MVLCRSLREQAPVPPSEGELLPPPFHGGVDGSPLFPSPPLEGRTLYGLSTWSFGNSDAEADEAVPFSFAAAVSSRRCISVLICSQMFWFQMKMEAQQCADIFLTCRNSYSFSAGISATENKTKKAPMRV